MKWLLCCSTISSEIFLFLSSLFTLFYSHTLLLLTQASHSIHSRSSQTSNTTKARKCVNLLLDKDDDDDMYSSDDTSPE